MQTRKMVGYLRKHVRSYGIVPTLHDLQCRLFNRVAFFQIQRGMTIRMQDVKDHSLFEAPGFEGRFVAESELWDLAQDSAHELSPRFLSAALMRGDRCYALFDGRVLTAYGWYSELRTPLDENFMLHFDRDWMYMYKGYTMPEYRGKRLHAVGMCQALQALTEGGKKGLISCVASNNFASLRSVTRMGYRIFGDVWLLRAAGRSLAYATPGCAEYGFRAEPRDCEYEVAGARDFRKQ